MINEEIINNISRMQEYWNALSMRQRVDIYLGVFGCDLRRDPLCYSNCKLVRLINFDILWHSRS